MFRISMDAVGGVAYAITVNSKIIRINRFVSFAYKEIDVDGGEGKIYRIKQSHFTSRFVISGTIHIENPMDLYRSHYFFFQSIGLALNVLRYISNQWNSHKI